MVVAAWAEAVEEEVAIGSPPAAAAARLAVWEACPEVVAQEEDSSSRAAFPSDLRPHNPENSYGLRTATPIAV